MPLNITRELAQMSRMTPKQLREKYQEVFGEPTRSGNRRFMEKRIAWRLQANEEGDLPDRVRRKALAIARDSDLRTTAPASHRVPDPAKRTFTKPVKFRHPKAPVPGSQLARTYKGRQVIVTVLADGFEYEGEKYRSLSAIAKAITGSHVSGNAFFGLTSRKKSKETS